MEFGKIFIILSIMMLSSSNAIILMPRNGTVKPFEVETPLYEHGPNITRPIFGAIFPIGVSIKELQSCNGVNPIYARLIRNNIAMVAVAGGCAIERHIMVAQNAGARAVILVTQQSWLFCRFKAANHTKYNITIPAVCMDSDIASKYLAPAELQSILLTRFTSTRNEFDKVSKGLIIFLQVFFFLLLICGAVLCIFRLIQLIIFEKQIVTYGKLSVLFFGASNIMYFSLWVDPYLYWRKITIFPRLFFNIYSSFIVVAIGFAFCTMNLVHILIKISGKKNLKFLTYIIGSLIISFVFIVNVIAMTYYDKWYPTKIPIGLLNAIITGVMIFFFCVGGTILLMTFRRFSKKLRTQAETRRNRKYLRLGVSICMLGFSALFSLLLWVLAYSNISTRGTSVSLTIYSFGSTGIFLASISIFFMFSPTKKIAVSFSNKFSNNSGGSHHSGKEDMHSDSHRSMNNLKVFI